MSMNVTNFNSYFDSIQQKPKIGELEDAPAKITSLAEYRSQKSGKTSIKLTISVNGGEIYTYLGYSNEKSAEISKARLVNLSIAAIGYDGTKKLYEDAANDEDVTTDAELIVEIANKLNKKLKKNPVDVIVSRKKEGDFWDTKWRLPSNDTKTEDQKTQCSEQPPLPEEGKGSAESTDEFLKDLT
jgi:hypothetical protein